jgi:ATP-dependent RNA helicase DeaD
MHLLIINMKEMIMTQTNAFEELGLPQFLVTTLIDLGYETPTPVQEEAIPALIQGRNLVAQAQTGTGKTAAFALPTLLMIDIQIKKPQAIIIAPTRELAIQVAEACQSYAKKIPGFQVTPIYGGQDYGIQLRALKRGAHIVVGTPGRLMDHMRQGTLATDALKMVVLDEADEMLKMGFIDDVEWILAQIPQEHQTALFSATMPDSIQKIANRYLKDPQKIAIKETTKAESSIEQFSIHIPNRKKMDVLTRILEVEEIEASIIFVRTRNLSSEVAEKLQARGYSAAALNGDMNQAAREKTIARIKNGSLDIIVATDVAARGIDVERITHVFNYDIPHDVEAYIHRIGRTGRAGRKGTAILFVTPREGRLLNDIERATKRPIEELNPPSHSEIHARRKQQIVDETVQLIKLDDEHKSYKDTVLAIMQQADCDLEKAAAALAYLLQKRSTPSPIAVDSENDDPSDHRESRDRGSKNHRAKERSVRSDRSDRTREHAPRGSDQRSVRSDRSDRSREHAPRSGDQRSIRSDRSDRTREHAPRGGEQRSVRSNRSDRSREHAPRAAEQGGFRSDRRDRGSERNSQSQNESRGARKAMSYPLAKNKGSAKKPERTKK